jgi:hypothetical protein
MVNKPLVTSANAALALTKDMATGAQHLLTGQGLRFLTNITNALNGTVAGTTSTVTLGNGQKWSSGVGSPENVIAGNLGDFYSNNQGGSTNTFWVKESGVNGSRTGWVNK